VEVGVTNDARVPVRTLAALLEGVGYTTEPPTQVSPGELFHRFSPPLGSKLPRVNFTSENGLIWRNDVEFIKKVLEDFGAR
jgi:hypothetical protein